MKRIMFLAFVDFMAFILAFNNDFWVLEEIFESKSLEVMDDDCVCSV